MSVIHLQHITKQFGSGHTEVKAVQDVSLTVKPGEIILIMGPSGSGKTTLLSIMGTLLHPTTGTITLGKQDVTTMSRQGLSSLRLKQIGFVFQSFNLLASLTAEQNVMVPLLASGVSTGEARRSAREALTKLGLGERLRNLPQDLSGGQKQRVAIARALVNKPQLILADEPTANLDSKTGRDVANLLSDIACREDRPVIIVSHDPRLKDFAKRIITIEDGVLTKEEKGGHDRTCAYHKGLKD